jgi:hypothetical protein
MPAILKILIIFAAVLMASRIRVHFGIALISGGLMLGMWSGMPPAGTMIAFRDAVLDNEFILLMVLTALIIEIGRYITSDKNADELVGAVRRWGGKHGSLFTIMGLPAVIGLIPMPAGALFSAPFVEQTGQKIDGQPEWKSAINYWFRHIWEYWWPLYPGVIMAMFLFDMIATWKFFAVMGVFTPVVVYAGYRFLLRRHVNDLAEVKGSLEGSNRRALFLMLPITAVLLCAMVLPTVFKVYFGETKEVQLVRLGSVVIGLVIALAIAFVDDLRQGRRGFGKEIFKLKSLGVLLTLSGVLVFKALLDASGLLPVAAKELSESGMPVEIVIAFMPFIAGIVTGICLGFVGAGFPLVVALVAAGSMTPLAALVLAYGFGYMGMMLSPVHLCLLVTKDYFAASLKGIYRQIIPCTLAVLAFALVLHAVLRFMGW